MRKKLLLAEDSVTMQKVFELAFAQSDISVIPVDNGHDAVRLVEEIAPDVVVADVTLPGRDGYAVASAIRETESIRDIPVLILCGTLLPLDQERVRACGANGVLLKPFEVAELLEKVEEVTRERTDPTEAETPPEAPRDEHWDFTDVLDEVGADVPIPRVDEPARGQAEAVSGLPGGRSKDEPMGLDEFDVSIDEIEERAPVVAAHIEGSILEDAPSAVTDLEPVLEEAEEIEEIQEIQELPEIQPLLSAETAEAPPVDAAGREPVDDSAGAPPVEMAGERPEMAASGLSAEPASAPPASQTVAEPVDELHAALKEQFAARADAIFRAAASEAVEKAMWEMMDRLTAEFSEKVRESVEAVAWEVIPAAAEALIREEIARIRTQTGKPSA